MENDKQYVSKINGYYVKDLETDEKLDDLETEINGDISNINEDISAINGEITTIEENYLDMRNIYEIVDEIAIPEGESQAGKYYEFPTGFTQNNTRVIYYDLEYPLAFNGYSMSYYSQRMGITLRTDQQSGEQIYVGIGRAGSGTEAQTWHIRVGLIKLPINESQQQGE